MKSKCFSFVILVLLFMGNVNSQQIDTWDKTTEDKIESKKFKNNFFVSAGLLPLFHYFNTDIKHENNIIRTEVFSQIFQFELGFRYNLYNYHDNLSLSISAYPFYGISDGVVYIGTTQMYGSPILLELNMFNNSTFNNINKLGFSFGFGRKFTFGDLGYKNQTNYLRLVSRYNKYSRKFSEKYAYNSKLINGYLGIYYGFSGRNYIINNPIHDTELEMIKFTEFGFVLGRTFGFKKLEKNK